MQRATSAVHHAASHGMHLPASGAPRKLTRAAWGVGQSLSGPGLKLKRKLFQFADKQTLRQAKRATMVSVLKDDKRRKTLLHSDNYTKGPLWVMWRWQGTIMQSAVEHPFFWLPLLFWALPITTETWAPTIHKELPSIDMGALSVAGTFVAFFVVFYTNQCYNRWVSSYDCACVLQGRIIDVSALCAGCLGRDNRRAAQIVRYMNLIHVLAYVGLSPEYDDVFFELLAADLHLVSEAELAVLRQIGPNTGGACNREVVCWTIRAITVGTALRHCLRFSPLCNTPCSLLGALPAPTALPRFTDRRPNRRPAI